MAEQGDPGANLQVINRDVHALKYAIGGIG
jgi:hypothetical protein